MIITKTATVLILSFCIFLSWACSQEASFTPDQIREDVEFMLLKMEEIHPDLYHSVPKEIILNMKDSLFRELTGPVDRKKICRLFIPLVTRLNDGHTSLGFPEQEIARYIRYGGRFFPARVLIRDDRIHVLASHHDTLPKGSIIHSVNGEEAPAILNKMRDCVSGEQTRYRDARITDRFAGLYWLLFQEGPDFIIEYQPPGLPVREIRLEGIREIELRKRIPAPEGKSLFEYREPGEKTAMIIFRSFSRRNQWKRFLENTFADIRQKGTGNLIIDIRENGGGNSDLGDDLFHYITDTSYAQVEKMRVKMSDDIIESGWGKWLPADTIEYYRGKVYTTGGFLKDPGKNELGFNGEVFLLTGPKTFSSANMFASAFKCYGMGTIIGEETGGVTVSFGDVRRYLLPNSQLSFGCSFKQFYEACGREDGRGVLPDHEVRAMPRDSTDRVLEYALELISFQKRPPASSPGTGWSKK
jgi:hypothetical protein